MCHYNKKPQMAEICLVINTTDSWWVWNSWVEAEVHRQMRESPPSQMLLECFGCKTELLLIPSARLVLSTVSHYIVNQNKKSIRSWKIRDQEFKKGMWLKIKNNRICLKSYIFIYLHVCVHMHAQMCLCWKEITYILCKGNCKQSGEVTDQPAVS